MKACAPVKRHLQLLNGASDAISDATIEALAAEPRDKSRGAGGTTIWDRARRFLHLRNTFDWSPDAWPQAFVSNLIDRKHWIAWGVVKPYPWVDSDCLLLLCEKTSELLRQSKARFEDQPIQHLRRVAQYGLRHQIATNDPLTTGEPSDFQASTLWDAKEVTAEARSTSSEWGGSALGHCVHAAEYPGTDADYEQEQRRLFYVSITRTKETLVIFRALKVSWGLAKQLGLTVTTGAKFWADLKMSPFLRDILVPCFLIAIPGSLGMAVYPNRPLRNGAGLVQTSSCDVSDFPNTCRAQCRQPAAEYFRRHA